MKSFISIIFISIILGGCGSKNFPTTVPDDFKIEYHSDGGMVNEHHNIILQLGECKDEGRKDDSIFSETFVITEKADMESLYVALKNINAFTLKYRTEKEVYDRGGESVRYTINGKTYEVKNSGLDFISKKDAGAFGKSIFLILDFTDSFKEKYISPELKVDTVKAEPIDSTIISVEENQVDIPSDFTIQYDYEAGMTGDHQTIILKLGPCSDEGNKIGEEHHSRKWNNTDKNGFSVLYQDLKKLNAFQLKYTEKGQVYDRGGENLTFTMNNKKYKVFNSGNCFINPKDADTFKKVVKLILDYASKSGK